MIGKCVAVHPDTFNYLLGKTRFLIIVNELDFHYEVSENDSTSNIFVIDKGLVIAEINKEDINKKRIAARDLHNEYKKKRKQLFDEYHSKMISIGEE